MEPRQRTKAMLHYPDFALMMHAVERANLTADEWQVVDMREHQSYTVEGAAEALGVCEKTVKNRYNRAMGKLDQSWDGLQWVNLVVSNIKQ